MRIIDADALMDYISRSINAMTEIGVAVDGEYLWGLINNGIENAPTIEPKITITDVEKYCEEYGWDLIDSKLRQKYCICNNLAVKEKRQ